MTRADPAQRPSLEEIGQRLKALCLGRKTRSPPFRPVRPAGHTPPPRAMLKAERQGGGVLAQVASPFFFVGFSEFFLSV